MVRPSSLLEIKTRSAYQLDEWLAGVPDGPALQTHWYLAVTGYEQVHVAALLGGYRLVVYCVDLRSWHFRLDDNPSLSVAYIDALRAAHAGGSSTSCRVTPGRKRPARVEGKPIKCLDHPCDGLRYVIHSTAHGWRQVSDVLRDGG
ncbi:hypothetical protein [Streptomyces sp. NPDC048462]|uniref:hypothetical protein n=1 Tax=Streptomyces sp. NPDC048462 TaxID=3365555 RepID=UPI00370F9F53